MLAEMFTGIEVDRPDVKEDIPAFVFDVSHADKEKVDKLMVRFNSYFE